MDEDLAAALLWAEYRRRLSLLKSCVRANVSGAGPVRQSDTGRKTRACDLRECRRDFVKPGRHLRRSRHCGSVGAILSASGALRHRVCGGLPQLLACQAVTVRPRPGLRMSNNLL